VFHGEGAFKSSNAIVHRFEGEALGAETLGKKPAQLNVIVDDENTIHSREHTPPISMVFQKKFGNQRIYKSLLCFANLDRTPFESLLKL